MTKNVRERIAVTHSCCSIREIGVNKKVTMKEREFVITKLGVNEGEWEYKS